MDEHRKTGAPSDTADSSTPLIIRPLEIADLIQQVIKRCPPSSEIVVCCTEEELVYRLLASLEHLRKWLVNDEDDDVPADTTHGDQGGHSLLHATLRQLHATSKIKMTFCPSLEILQAYIASYGLTNDSVERGERSSNHVAAAISAKKPFLMLLNPLSLHYETATFSAQGVSRTFASAVDAAFRGSLQLVVVECPGRTLNGADDTVQAEDEDMHDEDAEDEDPWEHEVPILNSTVKSFGAGDRAWNGRTVTLRQVAQRWFDFVDWNG